MAQMTQTAPFPEALQAVLNGLGFMPGWAFELRDCPRHAGAYGLTLVVEIQTFDAYKPGEPFTATHYLSVPPMSYDRYNWARWLLEQILLVQRHEAMESFIVDGERLFAPGHGGGHDNYYPLTIY